MTDCGPGCSRGLPRVSVVVPTYNHADILPACLDAILQQDCSCDYEVIVVDDGSSDSTAAVVSDYASRDKRVHYLRQINRGPAAARNKGAQTARGEILVFTDDDCIADPTWLREMIRPFDDNHEIVAVKGAYRTRQQSVMALFAQAEFESRYRKLAKLKYIDFVDTYSAAFKRNVFLEMRGFDTSFPKANNEDVEFSYRMDAAGHKMVFNLAAIVYHRHPATLQAYLKTKFGRAYWRMVVYRAFPHKMQSDTYTPQTLKFQILLALILMGVAAASVFHDHQWLSLTLMMGGAVFGLSTVPFVLQVVNLPAVNRVLISWNRWVETHSFISWLYGVSAWVRNGPLGRACRCASGAILRSLLAVLKGCRAIVVSRWIRGGIVALRKVCSGVMFGMVSGIRLLVQLFSLPFRAVALVLRWLAGIGRGLWACGPIYGIRGVFGRMARTRLVMACLTPFVLFLRALVMGLGVFWGIQAQHLQRSRFSQVIALMVADAVALTASYSGACLFRHYLFGDLATDHCPLEVYVYLGPIYVALFLVSFILAGLYRRAEGLGRINELVQMVKANFSVAIIIIVGVYLIRYPYSRVVVASAFLSALLLVPLGRWVTRSLFFRLRQAANGRHGSRMLIVGLGEMAEFVFHKLQHTGFFLDVEVVGFVAPSGVDHKGTFCGCEIVGASDDIDQLVAELEITDVVVAMPQATQHMLMTIVDMSSRRSGVHTHIISNMFDLISAETDMAGTSSIPIAYLRNENMAILNVIFKRIFDIVFSCLVIMLTFPVWLMIMIAIKLESEGPSLFRQDRVGNGGRIFRVYKFRTMYVNMPHFEYAPAHAGDPRVTKVGRFLRRTSLDEIPQFLNVLAGDMSVVGPRPEMPFIVAKYSEWEKQRLKVKPGLTGLWQIMGRKDLPLHESLEYDFYYIKNQSLLLDLIIIIRTVAVVLSGKGAY